MTDRSKDPETAEESGRAWDATTELPCLDLPAEPGIPLRLMHAARTDTGLVRDHNEDDYVVLDDAGVYLVADGMGGHNAGSLASELCVEAVREFFDQHDESDESDPLEESADPSLAQALIRANVQILERSHSAAEFSGMGTTAVGFRATGNKISLAHAGDSRAYLFRNGALQQLTLDHSLGNFLRSLGRDAEAQVAEATMSNVIMRALGLEPDVEVESDYLFVQPGDRLLLCSDGLSDLVGDEEIRLALMARRYTREEVVDYLVDQALDAGGRDNITVLLVDCMDPEAPDEDLYLAPSGTMKMHSAAAAVTSESEAVGEDDESSEQSEED